LNNKRYLICLFRLYMLLILNIFPFKIYRWINGPIPDCILYSPAPGLHQTIIFNDIILLDRSLTKPLNDVLDLLKL